jgi:Xaa-Pro aminopeptidase
MQYARAIKNEDEIMCLKHAAAIVDGAFHKIASTIAPGMKENDLQAAASHEMHRLGAQWVHNVQVTSGNRTHPHPHLSSDRLIQPGDMIFMDIVCLYNGYHTCVYRCFCCGKPNQKQLDIHKRCLEYQNAASKPPSPA